MAVCRAAWSAPTRANQIAMLNIPLKDYFRETRIFNSRLGVITVIGILLTLILLARLVYLQIISHHHYTTLSKANSIRPVPISPVRGLIMDRNGVVLAENRAATALEITPYQVKDMGALITRLSDLVRISERDKTLFYKQLQRRSKYEWIAIRSNLNHAEAGRIAVNLTHLNGVELRARLLRYYPQGSMGIHFVGYVGRINEDEAEVIDKAAYRGTQHIGKLGIELNYENILLGKVGIEQVEANAHGRQIRVVQRIEPKAGKNLYLTIDANMQAYAQMQLGKRRGAVIAMIPRTGEVLAFVSTPTYNPNAFVNGIDGKSYETLLKDPDKPLINRALNGVYSPGSTIKAFLGLAALSNPDIDANKQVQCPGWFKLPRSRHIFRDWKKKGHGLVRLHDAIVQSCDVYFYKLAVTLGIDYIRNYLGLFGFGNKTGIDMPGESSGVVPSRAWMKEVKGLTWQLGDTIVTGIGQGPLLVTPLQLATAMSIIANNGIKIKPRMVYAIEDPITKKKTLIKPVKSAVLPEAIRQHLPTLTKSLTAVVHERGGTARRIGWNAPYKIAGKTGTAQLRSIGQTEKYDAEKTPERLRDHALFIAFAPAEDPQIVVAVIVENGGHGSTTAAPIARKMMDFYLFRQPAFR